MLLFSCASDFSLVLLAADLQTVLVLLPGGHTAPNMAFGLIHIQDDPSLGCKGGVDVLQAVGDVFMYGCRKLERWHRDGFG